MSSKVGSGHFAILASVRSRFGRSNRIRPAISGNLRDDFHEISVGIAHKRIPIVVAGTVRRLNRRHTSRHELAVGLVEVIGPHDEDHGRTARRRFDAVHPSGRLDRPEADLELATQLKFDMFRHALGWSAEGLLEAEKITVEVQSGLNVVGVKIDQTGYEHISSVRATSDSLGPDVECDVELCDHRLLPRAALDQVQPCPAGL
jgi:hypothetical protein